MSRRYLVCALFAAACGDTNSTAATQINLDRPIDVAFACHGGLRLTNGAAGSPDQPIITSAAPPASCVVRSEETKIKDENGTVVDGPEHRPPGQEEPAQLKFEGAPVGIQFWVAFILEQGPGTVAFAKYLTKPGYDSPTANIFDANPLSPGKNAISVGEDPIAIATDKSGCHEIIANAGTCDLSDLDVNSVVDVDDDVPPLVRRMDVKNGAGQRIGAKPIAMIGEPATTAIGFECPKDTTGAPVANGLVYIAYPNCHLVAAVDTATGVIQKAIQYDALGVPAIVDGMNVTCPDECGGDIPTAGTRPIAIDLQEDLRIGNRRMAIGADNSPAITIVELDPVTTLPLSLSQVALENTTGDLGIKDVAISQQIGTGGSASVINDENANGGQFQFVYAVTTDGTVRVADVLTLGKECDTQVDPRFLRRVNSVKTLSCLPVGDPATPRRRPGVRGPGIVLTGDAVPLSVKISSAHPTFDPKKDVAVLTTVGYYALISATTGQTFVINIDDDTQEDLFTETDPFVTAIPRDISHQLRDGTAFRDQDTHFTEMGVVKNDCKAGDPRGAQNAIIGSPRATTINPLRSASATFIAADKVFELPNLRQVVCQNDDGNPETGTGTPKVDPITVVSELSLGAPESVRDLAFPDLRALDNDEVWTITYQGTLSNGTQSNAVDGPQVRESQMRVDGAGIHIIDTGRPFCGAGVEPFDIFQMRGCDPGQGDTQCPKGYRCFVHPDSDVVGLGECMLEDEAERLAAACKPFLTSLRRYTIKQAHAGELLLLPRRVELRTSPVDGCTDDAQCKSLADYSLRAPSGAHPLVETTPADTHSWTCSADPNRAPVTTGKRCELRCDADTDCFIGTVCQGAGAGPKSGFCMEGVTPPQSCVNAPQRYELRAGQAFAVVGSQSGFVHPIIADASGLCVKDPTASPLQIGRIPLTVPACDPAADPATGERMDGTFDPNPCSLTITSTDIVPKYIDANCSIDPNDPTVTGDRDAPAIRFRGPGMTFHLLDPVYPGDATCLLDRKGALVNIPLAFTDYQLSFRVNAGFTGLVSAIGAHPVRVVRGPLETLWVIDQGDVLSTSIGQSSTRGQVFRVPLQAIGLTSATQ